MCSRDSPSGVGSPSLRNQRQEIPVERLVKPSIGGLVVKRDTWTRLIVGVEAETRDLHVPCIIGRHLENARLGADSHFGTSGVETVRRHTHTDGKAPRRARRADHLYTLDAFSS